jgi:hypothetical protein
VGYHIRVDEFPLDHSGIWPPVEPKKAVRLEPETVILVLAWILAVALIVVTVLRGEAFGPDRAIALAFAVGCPLLARATLLDFARRVASRLRRR